MPTGDNATAIDEFMKDAITWLDQEDCVERYAYFGTADGYTSLLYNNGPNLSALGKAYAYTPYGGDARPHKNTSSHVSYTKRPRCSGPAGTCVLDEDAHVVWRKDLLHHSNPPLVAREMIIEEVGQDQNSSECAGPCDVDQAPRDELEDTAVDFNDTDVLCSGPCDVDHPPRDELEDKAVDFNDTNVFCAGPCEHVDFQEPADDLLIEAADANDTNVSCSGPCDVDHPPRDDLPQELADPEVPAVAASDHQDPPCAGPCDVDEN